MPILLRNSTAKTLLKRRTLHHTHPEPETPAVSSLKAFKSRKITATRSFTLHSLQKTHSPHTLIHISTIDTRFNSHSLPSPVFATLNTYSKPLPPIQIPFKLLLPSLKFNRHLNRSRCFNHITSDSTSEITSRNNAVDDRTNIRVVRNRSSWLFRHQRIGGMD